MYGYKCRYILNLNEVVNREKFEENVLNPKRYLKWLKWLYKFMFQQYIDSYLFK